MKKLVIIGNGFDLHHGLDTRYFSFGIYLKINYPTIYENLTKFYGFSNNSNDSDDGYLLWSEFEENLSLLDSDAVLEALSDSVANLGTPGFRDRDWGAFSIDIKMIVEELTDKLFQAFKEFILHVKYPASDLIENIKLSLDKDDLYLTFNYTDTLDRYYGIPKENILYIHEKAEFDDEVLILGHGVDPGSFVNNEKEEEPPEGLDDREYDRWLEYKSDSYDYSYELGKDELFNYFLNSFKGTENIISSNKSFFDSLHNISEINVIGHSLSEVDLPYISEILKSIKCNANWLVTYHNRAEYISHERTLVDLNIPLVNIKLITISELLCVS